MIKLCKSKFTHSGENSSVRPGVYVVGCNKPDYQLEIGKVVVKVDPSYYRPTEVDLLLGDPTKSKTKLGWVPKYDLKALVKEMVVSDLRIMKTISNIV